MGFFLDKMNHSFDLEIAKQHGVDAAIVIENFRFWIAKNKANGRHFYDGRWWTYNSSKAMAELFPYWSAKQIERIVAKLKESGVLLVGHYSQNAYDRTNWYALEGIDSPKPGTPFPEIGKSTRTDISTDINKNKEEPTALVSEPMAQPPERLPPCPTQELVDLYHHHLPMLPRVEVLNDGRRRALSARWREVVTDKDIAKAKSPKNAAVDFFGWYFGHASRSAFLTGRAKNWRADFDFLITPSKFAKVIEGHYHKDTV